MNVAATKDRLHLRIEQADEKMLGVLDELMETLFRSYHEATDGEEDQRKAIPEWAKPLTMEESLTDLREGTEQYKAGDYIALEESRREMEQYMNRRHSDR